MASGGMLSSILIQSGKGAFMSFSALLLSDDKLTSLFLRTSALGTFRLKTLTSVTTSIVALHQPMPPV